MADFKRTRLPQASVRGRPSCRIRTRRGGPRRTRRTRSIPSRTSPALPIVLTAATDAAKTDEDDAPGGATPPDDEGQPRSQPERPGLHAETLQSASHGHLPLSNPRHSILRTRLQWAVGPTTGNATGRFCPCFPPRNGIGSRSASRLPT